MQLTIMMRKSKNENKITGALVYIINKYCKRHEMSITSKSQNIQLPTFPE